MSGCGQARNHFVGCLVPGSIVQDFKKLTVWNRAHSFALDVYVNTKSFPSAERFGLTAQLRKSATSIPTNLAEGCGRSSTASLASFVQIATGSACEAEYQLLLARDVGYLKQDSYARLTAQVSELQRMLTSLHRTLITKTAVRGRS